MDLVAAVRCESYDEEEVRGSIEKSLDLIGGVNLESGNKLLIKPNLLGPYSPEKAVTTHPSIVSALIQIFQDRGLEVFLGDSSGSAAKDGTLRAFRESGLEQVASDFRVEFINFDVGEHVNIGVKNPNPQLKHIRTSKRLIEVDYIVNVPKLKTHNLTGYTGAIKNMFGILSGRIKTSMHAGRDIKSFSEVLVDIYESLIPDLTVMDAVVGMEGRGPAHGSPKDTGFIFSSFNGAALDYVVAKTIGFNPFDIEMIRIARERELFGDVKLVGEKILELDYRLPSTRKGRLSSFAFGLLKPAFEVDKDKCEQCYECYRGCPENAISIGKDKYPVWDMDECISCYCCDERCPEDAVVEKKNLVLRFADWSTRRHKNE